MTEAASDATIASAKSWAGNDPNPTTKTHVEQLLQRANNRKEHDSAALELTKLFPGDGRRIAFGTAGLRAAMKAGPLCMNDLTVLQTAQGLAKYCLQQAQTTSSSSTPAGKICAVVGYDHRCNPELNISSLSFAILTKLVFQEAGMECLLLDGFVLTPLVPFAIQKLRAVTGIMVTASHNPKEDNGYKVYASDACQIRAPMDQDIATHILHNLEPWTDYDVILNERKAQYPNDPCLGLSQPETTKDLLNAYFTDLTSSGLKRGQSSQQGQPLVESSTGTGTASLSIPKFAYTTMHGIGYPFAKRVFECFELEPFLAVPEQREPDPSFSTVPFPNPEEKGALDLAKVFARAHGCDVILANDPDADRLAVAEKDRTTGQWTVFTGDQIGTMLGHWIWNQIGKECGKPVSMCTSTVSSKMLAEIGRVEGFHVEDTLTGFKWIGARSAALHASGYNHLFGYEEAIGFACGNVIFDKDGVSAMGVFAELSLSVYREGKNLVQHMQSLYEKYGEFVSYNGYYFLEDKGVVLKIMERIRANGKYDLDLGPYQLESIRDLGVPGYDSSQPDHKPRLPTSSSAPMMSLEFANGCVVQLRPSGTEPKFKFYIEMKGQPGVKRDVVAKKLESMSAFVLERLLEPAKNGLKTPGT